MKRLLASSVVAVAAAIIPAHSATIELVTGNEYQPFTDENLPGGGLVTEIVRTSYEDAGHDPVIKFLPWRRGEKQMAEGKFVATFPYVKTEERLKKYVFSDPVFVAEEVPIVLKDNAGSINSYDDLKGKTLCMPVGYQPASNKLSDMIANNDVKEVKPRNLESCYKMLKVGRVDFLALERPSAIVAAKEVYGSVDPVSFEKLVLSQSSLHLIFDKGGESTEEEVSQFNAALQALKDSGKYEEIVKKHLESD